MVAPPLSVGAVQETSAVVLPAVALTAVGAPGTAFGVTGSDESDARESPAVLVATTLKL